MPQGIVRSPDGAAEKLSVIGLVLVYSNQDPEKGPLLCWVVNVS